MGIEEAGAVTPCYVISQGWCGEVSYKDNWCYGKSRYLGAAHDDADARALIHTHIRERFEDRNGLPLYYLSDHGNLHKSRAIRLRKR